MRKVVLVLVVAALGVGLWAILRGAPSEAPPPASAHEYPLGQDLRWSYRGPGNLGVVRSVGARQEIGGRGYWLMEYRLPLLPRREIPMRHAPEGVVTAQGGREHLLLRFPMVQGDRWTIDLPSESELADCTVLGVEETEFLGGKSPATKLEVRRRRRDGSPIATDYEWYAPGIGLVKMEVTLGVRATFVLDSFARTQITR